MTRILPVVSTAFWAFPPFGWMGTWVVETADNSLFLFWLHALLTVGVWVMITHKIWLVQSAKVRGEKL